LTETYDWGILVVTEIKARLGKLNQYIFYLGSGGYAAKAQKWANRKNKAGGARYRIFSAL
jgi:hypothetical protein